VHGFVKTTKQLTAFSNAKLKTENAIL